MISASTENEIAIHTASRETTLEDLAAYIKAHLSDYAHLNVLWDLSAINFYTITNTATKRFARRNSEIGEARSGSRSAMLLNVEMGPGKIRSLQQIFDENKAVDIKIFNERNKALTWLAE